MAIIVIGDIVKISDKVFTREFAAHYEKYRGLLFEVDNIYSGNQIRLCAVDANIVIDGYIHPNDLEKVK
jgi:hypothetical protein